jgi:2-hydroxychromene-2-carboxylate isomerase
MPAVEFLFDYASPYSYLANEMLATKLAGVAVSFRPVYLRGFDAFNKGVPFTAPKLAYLIKDTQRCAEEIGVPFRVPASFPVNGLYSLRGALAAIRGGMFEIYHRAMFRSVWGEGRETSNKEAVAKILRELGLADIAGALEDPSLKDELRTSTEAAARRGVFGVPTFFVGDEMFWGHDRLEQVARAARV